MQTVRLIRSTSTPCATGFKPTSFDLPPPDKKTLRLFVQALRTPYLASLCYRMRSMDKARATRMAAELRGKTFGGWVAGDLLDYGKSALAFVASKGADACVLKVFDPEIVERYGEAVQRERVE